jgi:hypothetical protein
MNRNPAGPPSAEPRGPPARTRPRTPASIGRGALTGRGSPSGGERGPGGSAHGPTSPRVRSGDLQAVPPSDGGG